MNTSTRARGIALVMAAALCLMAAALLAADAFPQVGGFAPEFMLPDQKGKTVSLENFRGKWVVFYFYPKDFTSGCTLEAHNFQRDLGKYRAKNAVIVGVSVDSPGSHQQFCVKELLDFTLLSDPEGAVSTRYNSVMKIMGTTLSARNTFLINPDGVLMGVFEKVKPATHSDDVLAALDEAQKDQPIGTTDRAEMLRAAIERIARIIKTKPSISGTWPPSH